MFLIVPHCQHVLDVYSSVQISIVHFSNRHLAFSYSKKNCNSIFLLGLKKYIYK